ncbi:serpin-ZX-like [Cucumis melo]|uniref:Serpin-ZX-like n=1 Tax=Cucumis melo TaxID=3656 RepID=A0A1S3BTC5_CUCME|nr:serpin-ZX-like [Cucumis melo]
MDIKESANHHNDAGFRLLKQLLHTEHYKAKNIIFSPFSIYTMLTLLANGASPHGQMIQHLLYFLKFRSLPQLNSFLSKLFPSLFGDASTKCGPIVTTANGVWLADDLPVNPSFQKLLETLYHGKLNLVDFVNKRREVMEDANSWVKEQTRGLIPEILKGIDESSRMILANAVYFKAAWSNKFKKSLTKDQNFYLLDGTSRKVPFMSDSLSYPRRVSVFDSFKVASLPYIGAIRGKFQRPSRFSMLIFLPNDRDGLPSLIQRACSESGFIDRHVPPKPVMLHEFKIPKFKFGLDFELEDILRELGLGLVFSGESGFTGMVEDPAGREVYVSKMFHKAVISVDEEGTEAAAVTMGLMLGCSLGKGRVEKIEFVADHPFLFVIKEDESGAVLFVGQVLDPSLH